MDEKLMKHGAVSWSELMTSNASAAKEFYGQIFGWEFEDMPMDGSVYTVFSANGEQIGGLMDMPKEAEGMPPFWGQYVTVDNVDETAEKVLALGGKVLMGPQDIPGVGRFCAIQDPQGAMISCIAYVAPEE